MQQPVEQQQAQPPKAYSYVRFSTPEQAKGDSLRRQTELAASYATLNGLTLDTEFSFKDLGVSAFNNKNAQTGALKGFLEKVEEGIIPHGSFLLVESLDRITRDEIFDAQWLFMGIIRKGLTIVTLTDNRRYSRESLNNNPTELIVSIAIMMRGNDESATKSRRLAAVNERKRKDALQGKLFTRALPAWLRWNDATAKHELIPERAEVLCSIFEKADAGWSKHRIARWLNAQEKPTWGIGGRKAEYWHSSYIQKLLTNSAAVGVFTPHRAMKDATGRKRVPLDPIANYFPAAIDADLFNRVAAQAKSRAARGRNADAEPRSIFAGVIKCAHCGGSVVRVSKNKRDVYLVCSRANQRAKGCRYLAVPYRDAESALTEHAGAIVAAAPRGYDSGELQDEIEDQERGLDAVADEVQELLRLAARTKSEAAERRLEAAEQELRIERERLRDLMVQRDTRTSANVLRRLETVHTALERNPLNVAEVNRALRQAVNRIVLEPEPERPTLTIYWQHAEQVGQERPIYTRRAVEAMFGKPRKEE
jgi:DNA invertase Pin-like site-specific DNA recombinase